MHPHLQVNFVPAAESLGAYWARSQAKAFYAGEDRLLQIDSHMRAVDRWDELWRLTQHGARVKTLLVHSYLTIQPIQ